MNNNLFTNECVSSKRIIYTPSPFARTSLLFLQETGTLQAKRPHVSSRQNLQSYLFFVVREGNGWLEYNGQHYELSKGSAVFIDCRKGYSQSSSETLWHLSWCHWSGNNMPAIYNKYCERGGKPVFKPSDPEPFISLLDELYATASSEDFVRDVKINTLLSEMIGLLFQETVYEEGEQPVANTGDKGATAIDVSAIKSYIDTHYQDQLTLELLTERFFFSKHYLARAFKLMNEPNSQNPDNPLTVQTDRNPTTGKSNQKRRFYINNVDDILHWRSPARLVESQEGSYLEIDSAEEVVYIRPTFAIVNEMNFVYESVNCLFDTNQDVRSAKSYRIKEVRRNAAILDMGEGVYSVKEKGLLII